MDQKTLIKRLKDIDVIKQGQFVLKSGEEASLYIDLRQIISFPDVLRAVADAMWDAAPDLKPDLICGVPYTALPIATHLSLTHNIPMIMRRKEAKSYGTKKQIEGSFSPGQTCLIIEDVITTGSSVIETAQDLRDAGLLVTDALVFLDRESTGVSQLTEAKITPHCVTSLSQITQEVETLA